MEVSNTHVKLRAGVWADSKNLGSFGLLILRPQEWVSILREKGEREKKKGPWTTS